MDKNRQEPFAIETVGGEVNSEKPLGLAAAFLEAVINFLFSP